MSSITMTAEASISVLAGASDQANIKLKPTGTAKFLSDKSNIELNNDYALQVYRKSNKDNDTGFAFIQ